MSSSTAISVENLGKCYKIQHQAQRGVKNYRTLRESLGSTLTAPFRKLASSFGDQRSEAGGQRSEARHQNSDPRPPTSLSRSEDFWALRDVSFAIKQGEAVGIIGRNGAGKSTLLKILSRITEPTTGRIELNGSVASLLEVGTGFHPELTGRENIYLNGAILGMPRLEIRKKFEEIVEFAEVEQFLDTPVKRYSSGMYVRLAFAVAAHLQPEILIVDEVLAVGDASFQQKCLGKMGTITRAQGRTVLFVSHNMQAISELCSRCIVLDKGKVICTADVDTAIGRYLGSASSARSSHWNRPPDMPVTALQCMEVDCSLDSDTKKQLVVKVTTSSTKSHKPCFLAIDIRDPMGSSIMQAIPRLDGFILPDNKGRTLTVQIELPALIPGIYFLGIWFGPHNTETVEEIKSTASFEITETPTPGRIFPHHHSNGYVVPKSCLLDT